MIGIIEPLSRRVNRLNSISAILSKGGVVGCHLGLFNYLDLRGDKLAADGYGYIISN